MKIFKKIVLVVAFCLLLWGVWFFTRSCFYRSSFYNDNVSIDLLAGFVLFLSFVVALYTYQHNRKHDEYKIAEKRREDFITNDEFKKIRMLIEHNDIELQTVIAITNIMESRKPGLLSKYAMELHEEFDAYLTYMESIAILANQDSITNESLQGYWSYYFKRLRGVHLQDFDDSHPILIGDIKQCINELYKNDKRKANTIIAEFKKYVPFKESKGKEDKLIDGVKDPIEEKHEKDESKVARINPVARPIWYYINKPEYDFEPTTIKLCVRLYKKKYVPLYEDGF